MFIDGTVRLVTILSSYSGDKSIVVILVEKEVERVRAFEIYLRKIDDGLQPFTTAEADFAEVRRFTLKTDPAGERIDCLAAFNIEEKSSICTFSPEANPAEIDFINKTAFFERQEPGGS